MVSSRVSSETETWQCPEVSWLSCSPRLDLFVAKGAGAGETPVSLVTQLCFGGHLADAMALRGLVALQHTKHTILESFFWHVIFYLLQEYIYIHSYDFMYVYIMYNYHRKFISQTSDNMDRWKAEMGRVREEKRREEERGSKKRQSEEKRKEERGSKKRQLEERRSRCAKR